METRGEPPEFYRLQIFNCKGIEPVVNERVLYRDEHLITSSSFPANSPEIGYLPLFRMESPIFHDNIYYQGLVDLGSYSREGNNYVVTPGLDQKC